MLAMVIFMGPHIEGNSSSPRHIHVHGRLVLIRINLACEYTDKRPVTCLKSVSRILVQVSCGMLRRS
jgi:hypothetical protein